MEEASKSTGEALVPPPFRARVSLRFSRDEQGFTLVFAAIFFPLLLGFGALSVDLGNWYMHIERVQRGVDAAALAGAPHLPSDPTTARERAEAELLSNGYATSMVTFNVPYPGKPEFMKVAVRETVDNGFFSLLGVDDFTFERRAVASYVAPVHMGSPNNVLGKEPPVLGRWGTAPQHLFTLGQNSAGMSKSEADRWNTNRCTSTSAFTWTPDKCGTVTPGRNDEHVPGGSDYIIEVEAGSSGTLAIEAWDALSAPAGMMCDKAAYTNLDDHWPAGALPARYKSWSQDPWVCAGDVDGTAPTMEYRLYAPNSDVPINLGNTCQPRFYPPLSGNPNLVATAAAWATKLKETPTDRYDTRPANTFHNWVRVCDVPLGGSFTPGQYRLNVQIANSEGVVTKTRMTLRAGFVDAAGNHLPAMNNKVQVYANDRLVSVIQDAQVVEQFHVAKLTPSAAGRLVDVQMYDLGDRALNYVKFYFADGTPVPSCTKNWHSGAFPDETDPDGCHFTLAPGTSNNYNARLVYFNIPLPMDYTCDPSTAEGCWLKMEIQYKPSASGGVDGTSWAVGLSGTPVRLFNEGQLD